MSVVTWHPDDLIDKRRSGTLSAGEHERLDEHLAGCALCSFELAVARDFAREIEGADNGGADRVASLVSAALLRQVREPDAPEMEGQGDVQGLGRRPAVWTARALLAAGIFIAATAAAYIAAHRIGLDRQGQEQPDYGLDAPRTTVPVAPPVAVEEPAVAPHPAAQPEEHVAPAEPAPSAVDAAPSASSGATEDAGGLFARANQARRDGQRERALALYRRLDARFPGSEEAKLSHAIVGRMLLEVDPKAALSAYEGYGKEGALGEEALIGKADAHQRLGDVAGERAAWQELLARFPGSIHASRARARLAALSPPK